MSNEPLRLGRREALRWLAVATAFGPLAAFAARHKSNATNTPTDPDLIQPTVSWKRTFTAAQLSTAAALCDLIIPAEYRGPPPTLPLPPAVAGWFLSRPPRLPAAGSDEHKAGHEWLDAASRARFKKAYAELAPAEQAALHDDVFPSASQVKVPDFLDEWASAPYPSFQADGKVLRQGLRWLDEESRRRFKKAFARATLEERTLIATDIAFAPKAKPEHAEAAAFFTLARNLVAGGYFTTPVGMRDVGYQGNVARSAYEGPSAEVLARLGLG